MARILRGVKSPFASSAGGGWSVFLSSSPVGLPWAVHLCGPWAFIPAIFGPSLHGFLEHCNFWPFLASVLACVAFSRVGCGFPWVRLRLGLCGASCGCYSFCLRAVSICKGKKALLPLFFALPACLVSSLSLQGLPCLSVLVSFHLGKGQKKNGPLWVVSPWVVVFVFSY